MVFEPPLMLSLAGVLRLCYNAEVGQFYTFFNTLNVSTNNQKLIYKLCYGSELSEITTLRQNNDDTCSTSLSDALISKLLSKTTKLNKYFL